MSLKTSQVFSVLLLEQFVEERLCNESVEKSVIVRALDKHIGYLNGISSELLRSADADGSAPGSEKIKLINVGIPHVQAESSPFDQLRRSPSLREYGRELRRLADEFEESQERRKIRELANQVKVRDLTKQKFLQLLKELFPKAEITRTRIMALFFFCTDVIARTALIQSWLTQILIEWMFDYTIKTLSPEIAKYGGWSKILRYFAEDPNPGYVAVAAVAFTCFAAYKYFNGRNRRD